MRMPAARMSALLLAFGVTLVGGCERSDSESVTGVELITAVANSTGSCEPWPQCARAPSSSEDSDIGDGIDNVDSNCLEQIAFLENLHQDARIMVYDHDDGRWGWIHNIGTDSVTIALWVGTFNYANEVTNTLRHEFGHEDLLGGSEPEADAYMTSCDGFETEDVQLASGVSSTSNKEPIMRALWIMTLTFGGLFGAAPIGAQTQEDLEDLVAVASVSALMDSLGHQGAFALSTRYIAPSGSGAQSLETSIRVPMRLTEKLGANEQLSSFSGAQVCPGSPATCRLTTDSDIVVAVSRPTLSGDRPSVDVIVSYRTASPRSPVATALYRIEVTLRDGVATVTAIRLLSAT